MTQACRNFNAAIGVVNAGGEVVALNSGGWRNHYQQSRDIDQPFDDCDRAGGVGPIAVHHAENIISVSEADGWKATPTCRRRY